MKVEIKIGNDADKFNISKYLDNNKMYAEQKRTLNRMGKIKDNIREQLNEHIAKCQELARDIRNLSNDSEDIENTRVQIKVKFSKVISEFLQQKAVCDKWLLESDNKLEEIKLHRELIYISENIVTRLEQEVSDVKQDRQLINKIIDEENMNCKSYDSVHIGNENFSMYFFIEPVIDFEIDNKIVITDFVVYPLTCEFGQTKKDELN